MTAAADQQHCQCAEARELIQLKLDESLAVELEEALAEHLSQCQACRAHQTELRVLREALRSMPLFELPAAVRGEVESATLARGRRVERWSRGLVGRRRVGAMAAAVALAVCGTWWAGRSPEPVPSEAELACAAEQLELVLGLTGRALARVERAAFHDVLGKHVLPAVERIPVHWAAPDVNKVDRDKALQENGSAES